MNVFAGEGRRGTGRKYKLGCGEGEGEGGAIIGGYYVPRARALWKLRNPIGTKKRIEGMKKGYERLNKLAVDYGFPSPSEWANVEQEDRPRRTLKKEKERLVKAYALEESMAPMKEPKKMTPKKLVVTLKNKAVTTRTPTATTRSGEGLGGGLSSWNIFMHDATEQGLRKRNETFGHFSKRMSVLYRKQGGVVMY
jgi:hypothetical protein